VEWSGGNGGNGGDRENRDRQAVASAYVLRPPALAPCISECETEQSGVSDRANRKQ
jgi:hypothetical protein